MGWQDILKAIKFRPDDNFTSKGEWIYHRNNPVQGGLEGKADKKVRAKKGKPIKEFKIEEESRDFYEVYYFKLKSQGDNKVVYEVTRVGGVI